MSTASPILQLELNEVPFRVLDEYVKREPNSTLAGLMTRSTQLATSCEDKVELDPWISWPTLHRGVSDESHRILHLGQMLHRVDAEFPPIWRILADAGRKVGVFGSVHSSHAPDNIADYAFYVPDFFDDQVVAHPAYLLPFQRFNLGMTRRSARNVDTGMPRDLLFDFMKSYPKLGISVETMTCVAEQLMNERKEPRVKLRRRSLQSLLMVDVFLSLMKKTQPDFATFYMNHVAAAMHRYWAAMFPGDYAEQSMSAEWVAAYSSEIVEAMNILDRILAKVKRYADQTGTVLVITTSMGQAAIDHQTTSRFATITDTDKFMSFLGFEPSQYRKRYAMVPCSGVVVNSEIRDTFLERIDSLQIHGARFVRSDNEIQPISYNLYDDNFVALYAYFESYDGPEEVVLGNRTVSFAEAGWGVSAHEDNVSCTAHHTRDGSMLVYNPRSSYRDQSRTEVSTIEITPAVLEHFSVAAPDYMVKPSAALTQALTDSETDTRLSA